MTETVIQRITLDINEVPTEVRNAIIMHWPDTTHLVIDSDGENYISFPLNKMYRLNSNTSYGDHPPGTLINKLIRIPLQRNKRIDKLIETDTEIRTFFCI